MKHRSDFYKKRIDLVDKLIKVLEKEDVNVGFDSIIYLLISGCNCDKNEFIEIISEYWDSAKFLDKTLYESVHKKVSIRSHGNITHIKDLE